MAVILKVAADAATIYPSVKEHIRIILQKKKIIILISVEQMQSTGSTQMASKHTIKQGCWLHQNEWRMTS